MNEAVSINGATLHIEHKGTGRDIVLVHSGITDSRMWDPQWDLLRSRYRVTRFDLRGYGQSAMPAEPYSHRADVIAVMDRLGIERAVLVGASYGGNVATEVALEYPDRVSALVLANSLVGMETPSGALRSGWEQVDAAADAGDLALAEEIELLMWVDGPHRQPDEVDPGVRAFVGEMNHLIFARADEQEAAEEVKLDPPARVRLGELVMPVQLVVGVLDQQDAMVSADAIRTAVPHASYADIADAAHLPSLERPDVFNQALMIFLDSL